jgi:hypothetical protein
MVVGYDTWHDSERKKVSAGAVVCSLNNNWDRFYKT